MASFLTCEKEKVKNKKPNGILKCQNGWDGIAIWIFLSIYQDLLKGMMQSE